MQLIPPGRLGWLYRGARGPAGAIIALTVATIVGVTPTALSASMPERDIPQYSKARVLGVWAAAALPMGILAWIVAPAIAHTGVNLIPALIGCLTAGLVWQFVLVLLLNGFSLRGLWLQAPSTSDGRRGGLLWLWALPFMLGFGALQLIPFSLPPVASSEKICRRCSWGDGSRRVVVGTRYGTPPCCPRLPP